MENWGDRDVYHQQDEDKSWAKTCLAMSLVLFALVLILVVIGVVLVAVIGLLL